MTDSMTDDGLRTKEEIMEDLAAKMRRRAAVEPLNPQNIPTHAKKAEAKKPKTREPIAKPEPKPKPESIPKPAPVPIKCAIEECENRFIPKTSKHKYCSSCRERINRSPNKFYEGKGLAESKEVVPIKEIDRFPIKIRKGNDGPCGVINNEERDEFLRCAMDKKYFLDTYGYILDPVLGKQRFRLFEYQEMAVDDFDTYRFNIIKKPRQMGISWLVSGDALHDTLFGLGKKVLMISKKETDSVKLLNKSKYIYDNLPLFLRIPEKEVHRNERVLKFIKQDSIIESVPSDPNAGRSEGLSKLIMDEAAFIKDARDIWKAAFHTLSTGGSAIILSTTNGVGNLFHELWSKAIQGENDFNPIELNWRMYPGRDDEWYETQLRNTSKKDMAQEVDCNFLQSGSPVFDAQYLFDAEGKPILLASVITPLEERNGLVIYQRPIPGKRYLKGVDSSEGAGTDFSHMVVLDADTLEEVATLRGKWPVGVYGVMVDSLNRQYPGPMGVERTGMGLAVVVKLQDLFTPDLYHHEDLDIRNIANPKTPRPGWVTSPKTKPVMISELEEAVRNAWIRFASRIYADEMLVYIYKDVGMGAAEGYNDDSTMAAAIAYQMRKHVSRLTFGSIAM